MRVKQANKSLSQRAPATEAPTASVGSGEGSKSALARLKELLAGRARIRPRPTSFGGLPAFSNTEH